MPCNIRNINTILFADAIYYLYRYSVYFHYGRLVQGKSTILNVNKAQNMIIANISFPHLESVDYAQFLGVLQTKMSSELHFCNIV